MRVSGLCIAWIFHQFRITTLAFSPACSDGWQKGENVEAMPICSQISKLNSDYYTWAGPALRTLCAISLDSFLNSLKQLISPISQRRKSMPRQGQMLPKARQPDCAEPGF